MTATSHGQELPGGGRLAVASWAAARRAALARPVDIGPLVVLRVVFGLLMAAGAVRFMARGWIHELYVAPVYHFTYPGFGWLRPLPEAGLWLVFVALALLGLLVAVGFATRLSLAAFFVLFTYVELLDQATYLNHYYFVSLFSLLLLLLPLNGRYSLDVWLGWARPRPTVPNWMIGAVRFQLGLVYIFAGLAKINPDWLLQAQPLSIWLHARAGVPLIGGLFDAPWVAYGMSWGGMLFDLTIPFWLSWPRTRLPAYLAVIVFHGLTGLLFNIGLFPWIMIGCTLVFFDWRLPPMTERAAPPAPAAGRPSRLLLPVVALFLAIQCLLPLRHVLYPGDVNWTEEGGRFAWRVMLLEKTGQVTFFVRDPAGGREWVVLPRDYLTPWQENQMTFQPELIAQFARHIATRYEVPVEVRAEAWVSWNGRASQLLIDPDANLAATSAWGGNRSWVLPHPAP